MRQSIGIIYNKIVLSVLVFVKLKLVKERSTNGNHRFGKLFGQKSINIKRITAAEVEPKKVPETTANK